jgi:hypothetical protein
VSPELSALPPILAAVTREGGGVRRASKEGGGRRKGVSVREVKGAGVPMTARDTQRGKGRGDDTEEREREVDINGKSERRGREGWVLKEWRGG